MISLIWDLTTAKRKKICPYYQGQSWTKYVFQRCIDYVDIAGRPPLGVYNHALMSRALKPLRQLGFLVYVLALRLNDAIWIRTQPRNGFALRNDLARRTSHAGHAKPATSTK